MSGVIPPLPNTPSWRGAKKSTGTTILLSFVSHNNLKTASPVSQSVSQSVIASTHYTNKAASTFTE
jgi:hypothetical protein